MAIPNAASPPHQRQPQPQLQRQQHQPQPHSDSTSSSSSFTSHADAHDQRLFEETREQQLQLVDDILSQQLSSSLVPTSSSLVPTSASASHAQQTVAAGAAALRSASLTSNASPAIVSASVASNRLMTHPVKRHATQVLLHSLNPISLAEQCGPTRSLKFVIGQSLPTSNGTAGVGRLLATNGLAPFAALHTITRSQVSRR